MQPDDVHLEMVRDGWVSAVKEPACLLSEGDSSENQREESSGAEDFQVKEVEFDETDDGFWRDSRSTSYTIS